MINSIKNILVSVLLMFKSLITREDIELPCKTIIEVIITIIIYAMTYIALVILLLWVLKSII